MTKLAQIVVMAVAAALEVGGDALIRKGLRGAGAWAVGLGFVVLGSYGLVLNRLPIDFSRLLGAYVGVFAVVSVVVGRVVFEEHIPSSTWAGLAVVLVGCVIIQLGSAAAAP